jgi:hypothetical protein
MGIAVAMGVRVGVFVCFVSEGISGQVLGIDILMYDTLCLERSNIRGESVVYDIGEKC